MISCHFATKRQTERAAKRQPQLCHISVERALIESALQSSDRIHYTIRLDG